MCTSICLSQREIDSLEDHVYEKLFHGGDISQANNDEEATRLEVLHLCQEESEMAI